MDRPNLVTERPNARDCVYTTRETQAVLARAALAPSFRARTRAGRAPLGISGMWHKQPGDKGKMTFSSKKKKNM
jgi:hypothetical protein